MHLFHFDYVFLVSNFCRLFFCFAASAFICLSIFGHYQRTTFVSVFRFFSSHFSFPNLWPNVDLKNEIDNKWKNFGKSKWLHYMFLLRRKWLTWMNFEDALVAPILLLNICFSSALFFLLLLGLFFHCHSGNYGVMDAYMQLIRIFKNTQSAQIRPNRLFFHFYLMSRLAPKFSSVVQLW